MPGMPGMLCSGLLDWCRSEGSILCLASCAIDGATCMATAANNNQIILMFPRRREIRPEANRCAEHMLTVNWNESGGVRSRCAEARYREGSIQSGSHGTAD